MNGTAITHTLRTLLASAALVLAAAGMACAQQVYWDDPGELGAGQRATLDLVFDGTEPAGAVTPPRVPGLVFLGDPGQASNLSIINGRRHSTLTFSYPVRAEREGRVQLPAFEVETSAGMQTVKPLTLEVGAATLPGNGGAAGTAVSDAVQARLTPANMTPYAGEVFDVEAVVSLAGGHRGEVVGTPSWSNAGLMVEPWSEGKQTANGAGVRFRTRAVAPQAGRIAVAPIQQQVQIETGRTRFDPFAGLGGFGARAFGGHDPFDAFFSQAQTTDATVTSNAAQLDVRPLPQPAPADFSGAVGQFTLASHLTPEQPKTGEPITWTLTVQGTGNWPSLSLPARAVPGSLRALQPKQRKEFDGGAVFSGAVREDLVLVPTQPGDLALEPVRFTYFDPLAGAYTTIEATPPPLHITGAALAAPAQPVTAPAAPPGAAADTPQAADAGNGHAPLPRGPLAGPAVGRAPLAWTTLRWLVAAPVALLLVFWTALAVRHARLTDPHRPQREALARMRAAVERIRQAADGATRAAALLDWQHAAATALGLDLAAPTAAQLRGQRDPRWREVWAGSEQALYGPRHALPLGWCEQALPLGAPTRRRWTNPLRVVAPRNLLSRLATAGVLLLSLCLTGRAGAEPLEQYNNGAFDQARDEWLARVQAEPADWTARYDLGLAQAQLGETGRAFGETLAAFAHAPRDASVRWNAATFATRLPAVDRAVAALAAGGSWAALAAPATWQMILLLATTLLGLGAALALHCSYQARPRSWPAIALLVIGGVGTVGAAAALHRYGTLADPRAAAVGASTVLRSVPTDAEQPQQQRPLSAGAVVLVQRDFLGWVKVGLADGETGWLRHGDLVPLYAPPSA